MNYVVRNGILLKLCLIATKIGSDHNGKYEKINFQVIILSDIGIFYIDGQIFD